MFTITEADKTDIQEIQNIMEISIPLIENPDWFVVDPPEYLLEHFGEKGFTLKAMTDNRIAGFLIVRIPGEGKENMACDYDFSKEEPHLCAHMESCMVHPDCRGHHLEARLFEAAEERLIKMGFQHMFGTVHPDNLASVKSFLRSGFTLIEQKEKYGGYFRNVMYKHCE